MITSSPIRRDTLLPTGFPAALQGCFVLFLLGFWNWRSDAPGDLETTIYWLCTIFTANFVWSVCSWYFVTGKLFDFYQMFLAAASLFNGGQFILEVFDLNDKGLLESKFNDELTLQTLFIVTTSMATLHLGALLARASFNQESSARKISHASQEQLAANLRLVGIALLAISIPGAILVFREVLSVVMSGGYVAIFQQSAVMSFSVIPKVLSAFIIPGAMFLLAGADNSRKLRLFAVGTVVWFAGMQFIIGERHNGALALMVLAWMWHRRVAKLNPVVLLGGALLLLGIVFPMVRAIRDSSGNERASSEQWIERFTSVDNPAVSAIHEMGGSVYTLAHTMTLVPAIRPYDYGSSYFYAVMTLFPNLFWDLHPTVTAGIPGEWISWEIEPWAAARGVGMGYSFIAEAYLNFGPWGAAGFLFLFGWVYARFVLWSDQVEYPARMAMVASAAFFFIFVARAEMAVIVRGLVWYAWIPYFMATQVLPMWQTWKSGRLQLAGAAR
jgi:oligosaccharide repeat unit polymerase